LLIGDVVTAAHSLVDVAEGLSASPLLDDLQRRGIRIRIENTPMT